jgi:hypothetical protein
LADRRGGAASKAAWPVATRAGRHSPGELERNNATPLRAQAGILSFVQKVSPSGDGPGVPGADRAGAWGQDSLPGNTHARKPGVNPHVFPERTAAGEGRRSAPTEMRKSRRRGLFAWTLKTATPRPPEDGRAEAKTVQAVSQDLRIGSRRKKRAGGRCFAPGAAQEKPPPSRALR